MIFRISSFFSKVIIKEHLIDEKDVAMQEYGFQIMLANLFNFCIVVVIGLVSGEILKALVFYVVFISLRIHSGGFHANSYGCCFLLFGTICAACIFLSNWFLKNNCIFQPFIIACTVNGLCVYTMAPIPHVNRQISDEEKVLFRKKSWIVLFVWVMAGTILLATEFRYIVPSIAVALLEVSILMLVASCYLHKERGEENEEGLS